MAIFPLTPDQTIAQMWSNGVRGALHLSIPSVISMHVKQNGAIHSGIIILGEYMDVIQQVYHPDGQDDKHLLCP